VIARLLDGIPVPPRVRVAIGWVLFISSAIAWPVSMLTWASQEQPTILSLSWIAVILEALNLLTAQELVKRSDEG
jgi:hypothetical protein